MVMQHKEDTYTLSDVAARLGVSARQIQYLREKNIVQPTYAQEGQGNYCFYTEEDIRKVYIALVVLDPFKPEAKKEILDILFGGSGSLRDIRISPHAVLRIEYAIALDEAARFRAS
jgi:DNA-binding transcriptional MerR regulator